MCIISILFSYYIERDKSSEWNDSFTCILEYIFNVTISNLNTHK